MTSKSIGGAGVKSSLRADVVENNRWRCLEITAAERLEDREGRGEVNRQSDDSNWERHWTDRSVRTANSDLCQAILQTCAWQEAIAGL